MIGVLCDPYAKKNQAPWSTESTTWPEVEYPDVYNYLVSTPSPYTKQEMKAYKSLEGYKYFVDGWVAKVLVQHGTTGVTIRWTGPLDWTSGLDYWTDLCETKQETAPIIT